MSDSGMGMVVLAMLKTTPTILWARHTHCHSATSRTTTHAHTHAHKKGCQKFGSYAVHYMIVHHGAYLLATGSTGWYVIVHHTIVHQCAALTDYTPIAASYWQHWQLRLCTPVRVIG